MLDKKFLKVVTREIFKQSISNGKHFRSRSTAFASVFSLSKREGERVLENIVQPVVSHAK